MVTYTVIVHTAHCTVATTLNRVYMKLVGTDGESNRKLLMSLTAGAKSFITGTASTFHISCPAFIGKLVLIELDKQPYLFSRKHAWFPAKVEVVSPDGDTYTFPIHRWISDRTLHRFREGQALTVNSDVNHLGLYSREKELRRRAEDYKWKVVQPGLPHAMKEDGPCSLPYEVQFSFTKEIEFDYTAITGLEELKLKGLVNCYNNWIDIDSIRHIFWCKRTSLSDYVQEHWREDAFFGYQFLNGANPMLIQRCKVLPENFPVTDAMVDLCGQARLSEEIKEGNIYLCDYQNLDKVSTNTIKGKKQYLAAPLVLLHKTPRDELKPVAIQLKQDPASDNPIFLPTDSEYDWLLAKIFVRGAEFSEHQLNSHLLRTHLLAEVFAVSLLRNLPMVHPLHKLLVPHTRYTLHINSLARKRLISDKGVFTQNAAPGMKGQMTILRRSLEKMTYASLCLPDDIAARGMQDVPNYYYRDDGLRLWDVIHRFVQGILSLYYQRDQDVQKDLELQKWISDIFEHGFLSQSGRGFPETFSTRAELVKFVTMVIFTCSAQHSAVNSGQFDYGGWMPNAPFTLQAPPPNKKGAANKKTLLKTLPTISNTVQGMAALWLLSKQSSDFVPLGQYPEERFTEEAPRQVINEFKGELAGLSKAIKKRNKTKEIPYTYLDPALMENSVAI